METWAELVVAVNGKFGRDKYQQHLEELENLKQCGSVDDYYVKFVELMHRVLLVYNRSYDKTFFVTKFVRGLKPEVKIAIKLHKPRTVDLALSLAKTQEELLGELSASKAQQKVIVKEGFKGGIKPAYVAKGILGAHPEENKKGEEKPKWEDIYESLKAARRARGECFKCGEKWGPGHKCPKSVQLHVLDELLEVLMLQDGTADIQKEEEEDNEEELTLSKCAAAGTMGKKTIRLQGMIQHQEVLILVDSGSSSNFIVESLVSKLQLPTERMPANSVTIADGGKMTCDKCVQVEWWCQGSTFQDKLKVLPIGGYDMILGMDWLEEFSPMWIDWRRKKLRFAQMGKRITLVGVKEEIKSCEQVTSQQLKGMLKDGAVS